MMHLIMMKPNGMKEKLPLNLGGRQQVNIKIKKGVSNKRGTPWLRRLKVSSH